MGVRGSNPNTNFNINPNTSWRPEVRVSVRPARSRRPEVRVSVRGSRIVACESAPAAQADAGKLARRPDELAAGANILRGCCWHVDEAAGLQQ